MGPRRPYYKILYDFFPVFFFSRVVFSYVYCFQYYHRHALRTTAYLANLNMLYMPASAVCSLSWKKAYIDPDTFLTRTSTRRSRKSTPCCLFHPAKLCLSVFWPFCSPEPVKLRCLACVLRPVRDWRRSECEWLALSPKFNVERHRWRENS